MSQLVLDLDVPGGRLAAPPEVDEPRWQPTEGGCWTCRGIFLFLQMTERDGFFYCPDCYQAVTVPATG